MNICDLCICINKHKIGLIEMAPSTLLKGKCLNALFYHR